MTESFDFEAAFNHNISDSDDEVLNMVDLDDLGLFDFNFEQNGERFLVYVDFSTKSQINFKIWEGIK